MRILAVAALAALAALALGCGSSAPAPAPVVVAPAVPLATPAAPTIANPLAFLVQQDEAGALTKASEVLPLRRHDWPAPLGYQISDSVLSDDGTHVIQTFSFPPFGPFVQPHGDGGQVAVVGADGLVRFTQTQDGGTPAMQYFVGQNCPGGTGWIVFGTDAPTGSWKGLVATLADTGDPTQCPGLSTAYTQYRLEQVTLPFIIGGTVQTLTLPTVISEHYSGASLASATALERSYFAQGYGLVRWEAWTPNPPTVDLSERCPAASTPAFSVAPLPGWQMDDCRMWTNLVPDGAMSVDLFNWVK